MIENVYLLLLFASSLGMVGLGQFVSRRHKQDAVARRFVVFCLICAAWVFFFLLDGLSRDFATRMLLFQVRSIYMVFFPTAVLGMVLAYTGHSQWLKPRRYFPLLVIPSASALLIITSNFHSWFFSDYRYVGEGLGLRILFQPQIGFKLYLLFSYYCLLVSCVVLALSIRGKSAPFRKQALLLLAGLSVPTLSDMIFTLEPWVWVWSHGIYLTPLCMIGFVFVSAWVLFRHRLFGITPVARAVVMENMSDAVLVFDANGRLADFNPVARRSLVLADHCLGKQVGEFLTAWPELEVAIDNAKEWQMSLETTSPPPLIFDGRLSPLYESDGTFCGQALILRDITAQRIAEERYRQLLDSNPLGMTVAEISTGLIVYANQKAAEMLALPREQVVGSAAVSYYADPADRERATSLLDQQGYLADFEVLMKSASGHTVWCMLTTSPTVYGGKPCSVTSIVDITERKQVEAALLAKAQTEAIERQQRAILEHLPVGVILSAGSGHNLVYLNPRFVEMFGYQPEQIPDVAHWWPLAYPDPAYQELVKAQWNQWMMRFNAGETQIESVEVRIATRDGQQKLVGVHTGKVGESFLHTFIDLTERAQAEEARRQRDTAEAANQAKSRFLANLSHEIRTPLNAILGFAQILQRDTSLGAEQADQIHTIYRSGEHLLQLINDILDMAKIEAGKLTAHAQPLDLYRLIRDVESMFRQSAANYGLAFAVEMAGLPAVVLGDEIKLRQVLINLLSNAVKFTPAGSVTLRIESVQELGLRFSVIDTGMGVGEEEMARLFEPFNQTISGRRTREGTGLGLALSCELVKLMGGKLEIESQPGQGSRFSFIIPQESIEPDDCGRSSHLSWQQNPPSIPHAGLMSKAELQAHLRLCPQAWQVEFKGALERGEMNRINVLLEQIKTTDGPLYQQLTAWAYECDHESMLDLLDRDEMDKTQVSA